jgi:hypothetical protein
VPCLRRIESITFASWILTLKKDFTPKVSNTTSPKAIEINNNLNGTISRSYMAIFKETIITTETTTVTKSRQFHVEVSQTTSEGFNVGVAGFCKWRSLHIDWRLLLGNARGKWENQNVRRDSRTRII